MERYLLKIYRKLPKWVKRVVSAEMRDYVLNLLSYFDSSPNTKTLRLRHAGIVAGKQKDWRLAAQHWQHLAAMTTTAAAQVEETAEGEDLSSEDTQDMLRRSTYARNELRRARMYLAQELFAQGRKREFNELACRIVETIPDQRVFKNDPQVVELVATYVQDALRVDGIHPAHNRPVNRAPQRIVFCLDVLKVSDVHTHARVIFAICRNLLALDPRIEIHVVVTNERFAVTTPIVAQSFTPTNEEMVRERAQQAFPDDYGKRFFFHMFRDTGLEGIVRSCKEILDIAPDVILYGGGHKGFYSNESRVLRHCLYDSLPTAFFFVQSNNEVDPKLDVIIARGPHAIVGDPGTAQVRIQPYPTITDGQIKTVICPERQADKIIISAITGVRMDLKMKEQSDSDMRAFFSILDKTPGAVWHFIGASNPEAVINANKRFAKRVQSGQVVVHPVLPMAEFSALVGKAALFLHLPGFTGGSGGASVARRAGIPILTFRHSDVAGRQPPETVFEASNAEGFSDLAVRLLSDLDLWIETVHSQFARTNWIRENAAQGFYDCLTEACRVGGQRLEDLHQDPDEADAEKAEASDVLQASA